MRTVLQMLLDCVESVNYYRLLNLSVLIKVLKPYLKCCETRLRFLSLLILTPFVHSMSQSERSLMTINASDVEELKDLRIQSSEVLLLVKKLSFSAENKSMFIEHGIFSDVASSDSQQTLVSSVAKSEEQSL